tara:strand:+ start:4992 stop:5849 length:858 start_codon:yes stop_codon:yes gene_type:complete
MPQFLHPNSEELNPFIRPNRRVFKNMVRQFRGTETTMGQQGDLTDKFNRIYDSMIKLIASLGEINNTLKLGGNNAKGSDAMSRYVSAISNINVEVARLLLFITQEVPSLQIFNTSQIQTLSGLNNQLVGVVQEIDQLSSNMPPTSTNKFRMILKPLINEVATLQTKLEGINTTSGRGSLTTFGTLNRNATRTQVNTPVRTPVRTRASSPTDSDFLTPAGRTPRRMGEPLVTINRGTAQTVPMPINTPEPRRSGRNRNPPERYGAGRIDLRLPTAISGGYTQRRFL